MSLKLSQSTLILFNTSAALQNHFFFPLKSMRTLPLEYKSSNLFSPPTSLAAVSLQKVTPYLLSWRDWLLYLISASFILFHYCHFFIAVMVILLSLLI
nr:MAG TPA: hypothetical protein [Caudoviricetes sp.]